MLPSREQSGEWSRLKTPAVVSIICLIATLLIAAQGFQAKPAHKGNSWFSRSSPLFHTDAARKSAGQSAAAIVEDTDLGRAAVLRSSIVDSDVADGQQKVKYVDHLTGTKDLPTGPHKEKELQQTAIQPTTDHAYSNVSATREVLFGMEVLIINLTLSGRPPEGVLLLFHGCSHSAVDWWYPSDNCTSCTALPEEVAITKAAVSRNYAVVAFSSLDRVIHRCWDTSYPPEKSKDIPVVLKVWQFLVEENGWEKIPHFALGGSSGGAFILYLAQRMQLSGLNPVIMSVPSAFLEVKPKPDGVKQLTLPPTFYVSMERDQIQMEGGGVVSNMIALQKQGVPVKSIVVAPRALYPSFFAERIESIDNATSSAMYSALSVEGCLNATGYLAENPRALLMMKKWQKALRDHVPSSKTMNFNKEESPVFEELNVAWAGHELVSDHIDEVLDWLMHKYNSESMRQLGVINP